MAAEFGGVAMASIEQFPSPETANIEKRRPSRIDIPNINQSIKLPLVLIHEPSKQAGGNNLINRNVSLQEDSSTMPIRSMCVRIYLKHVLWNDNGQKKLCLPCRIAIMT